MIVRAISLRTRHCTHTHTHHFLLHSIYLNNNLSCPSSPEAVCYASQVNPLLVTWRQTSWNTLEDLAANQSMAVLFYMGPTPTLGEVDKNKTVRVMPCLRTTPS